METQLISHSRWGRGIRGYGNQWKGLRRGHKIARWGIQSRVVMNPLQIRDSVGMKVSDCNEITLSWKWCFEFNVVLGCLF